MSLSDEFVDATIPAVELAEVLTGGATKVACEPLLEPSLMQAGANISVFCIETFLTALAQVTKEFFNAVPQYTVLWSMNQSEQGSVGGVLGAPF